MRILLTSLLAVAGLHAQATPCEESADLQSIYEADQRDRETDRIDWGQVGPRDRVRRERVAELLEVADKLCPVDLYRAAMVYQHGHSPQHYLRAHILSTAAAIGGHPPARRLAASTLDRYLHRIGQPQVLGMQLSKYPGESEFSPDPYDRELVPAAVRRVFEVPSRSEQEVRLRQLNSNQER